MPQVVSPSVPSDPTSITERHDALGASGTIERVPAQEEVVAMLDAIGPPPDQSATFRESLESRRAVSRLIEMRSRDYLGLI